MTGVSGTDLLYPIPLIDLHHGPGEGTLLGSVVIRVRLGWAVKERRFMNERGEYCEGTVGSHPSGLLALISAAREADGRDWLHVSVSRPARMPSYDDLALAKDGLIGEHREAYQIFPRRERHVNHHPFCLHLWSPVDHQPLPDFTRGNGMI